MAALLLSWLVSALALLLIANLVPGFRVLKISSALIAALVIGFLNMTLGLFLKAATLPLAILTFGLFSLVINAIILLIASKIVRGLEISGFVPALIGALILSAVQFALRTAL